MIGAFGKIDPLGSTFPVADPAVSGDRHEQSERAAQPDPA
jgi:hypothetical protein